MKKSIFMVAITLLLGITAFLIVCIADISHEKIDEQSKDVIYVGSMLASSTPA